MKHTPGAPAPVDLGVLEALVGNDPVAVAEVLAAFRITAPEVRDAMGAALAAGNLRALADGAHKLRSAASAIGAATLGALCASAEADAEGSHAEAVADRMALLDSELDAVLRHLEISLATPVPDRPN
jgi:HPt (histidine-containing phosphotransfer) domain-containing protein